MSDSATPWTITRQCPLSTGFSRQEYCNGLPFLLQGIFPTQGWNPGLLHCRQILLSHQGSLLFLWPSTSASRNLFKGANQKCSSPILFSTGLNGGVRGESGPLMCLTIGKRISYYATGIGQNVLSGFSIGCYRKTWTNFLANPSTFVG